MRGEKAATETETETEVHTEGSSNSSKPKKNNKQHFVKPTKSEVIEEMIRREIPNSEFEAEKFICNHESKGWKIKGQPMVSWRAAVGTWKTNLGKYGGNGDGNLSFEPEINYPIIGEQRGK